MTDSPDTAALGERETCDVSVCIANYNGENLIDDCLRSVLGQVTEATFEVLVYDDASLDRSVPLIRSAYPAVTLIESEQNRGFCVANNVLADKARGEYLLLLNNDAQLGEGALQALWAKSREDRNAILSLRQKDPATGLTVDVGMALDFMTVPMPISRPGEAQLASVMGACLWMPAGFFRDIGGFPEWFESVAEDLYVSLYGYLKGHRLLVIEDVSYLHLGGQSLGGGKAAARRMTTGVRRRYLSERNRLAVFLCFFPGPAIIALLPLWLLSWSLESLALAIRDRSLGAARQIYGRALRDAFARRDRIRACRRDIDTQRRVSRWEILRLLTWWPAKLRHLMRHGLPRIR